LGASFTDVPGGTADWAFTDVTGNYNDANGTAAIVISKADATIKVDGYTGVYDGDAHGATGTATGVKGETLAGLDLGASFTDVPGGTANWVFTDETGNYNDASGSVSIAISKANATIKVDGYTGVYDGDAHGATGAATGVKGEALAGLDLGASFTDVPGGTADWAFTDVTGNYNNGSGTAAIVITKANAKIVVNPYDVIYDALSHTAVGSATGVKGENLIGLLNLSGTTHTNAGTYSDAWSFAGNSNYNSDRGTVTDKITRKAIGGNAVTQSALNIAKMGTLDFSITSNQLVTGDTMAVFAGAKFTLTIGTTEYSIESTATVSAGGNTVYVSWRMSDELKRDLTAYLAAKATSASTAGTVQLIVSTTTQNYLFSDDFVTKLFSTMK
jgi:hypothetical protein